VTTAIRQRPAVRCPHCGQLEGYLVSERATGEIEIKCRRPRCGKMFTVDLSESPPNLPPTGDDYPQTGTELRD